MRVTSLLILGTALTGCDYGLTVVDGQLAPAAVRSVDIDDPRDGQTLSIQWRAPAGATVRVLRTVGDDPTSSTDASAVAVYEGRDNDVVDTLTGIEVGTSVHYGVFVVDGEAASAGVFAAEVLSAFLPPLDAQAVANTDGTVQLSWSAPAVLGDVVGYRVRRDDVELTTALSLDTTLLDTTAPLDVPSTYEIVGVDDDGNETTAATVTATAIAPQASVAESVVVPSLYPTAQASDGTTLWLGGFLDNASSVSFGDDVYAPPDGNGAVVARVTGAAGIVATYNVSGEQRASVDAIAVAGNGDVIVAFAAFGVGAQSFTVGDTTTPLPSLLNDDQQRLLLVRISAEGVVRWHQDVAVGASAQVETFLALDDDDSVWCGTTAYSNSAGTVRLPVAVDGRSILAGSTDDPDLFVMHVDAGGDLVRADVLLDVLLLNMLVDEGDGDVFVATVSSDFDVQRLTFDADGRLSNEVLHTFDEAYGITRLVQRNGTLLAVLEGLSQAVVVDGTTYDAVGTAIVELAEDGVRVATPTVLINGEPGDVNLDIAVLDDGTLAALVEAYKPGSFDGERDVPLTFSTTWGPITVESTVVADSFGGGSVSMFALLPDLEPTSTFGLAEGLESLVPAGAAVWVGGPAFRAAPALRVLDVEVPHDTDASVSSVFALVQP